MRVLKIALFASLAVNLLVVGFFVATAAKHWRGGDRPGPAIAVPDNGLVHRGAHRKDGDRRGPAMRQAPPMLLWPLMAQLSKEDRRAFAKSVNQAHKAAGFARSDMRALAAQLATALEADPFDVAAVETAFRTLRATMDARAQVVEEKMLGVIAAMPADRRKAIAADLRSAKNGRKRF